MKQCLLLVAFIVIFWTPSISLVSNWNCFAPISNITQRYGDLSAIGINELIIEGLGNSSECDSNEESFIISTTTDSFPIAKILAIEYNQCLKIGCNNITIHINNNTNQTVSNLCDTETYNTNVGIVSRNFYDDEGVTLEYVFVPVWTDLW